LPDEVQKMIDTRTGINVMGNLDQYMKLKIADSFGEVANNNNAAGAGLGLGAGMGIGLGMALPNMIQQSINQQNNESISDKLKKLKELLDMGGISQKEFQDKKKELLKQL
jgi:membrane protease subunit (stomatin/prohibitin family)